MPSSSRVLLERVVTDLDEVLRDDRLAGLSESERVEILTTAGAAVRRLDAVIVETVAHGDSGELPHIAGCRSQNELLQRTLAVDSAGATRIGRVVDLVRRDVNLVSGDRLPARWPALRDAMLGGALGITGMLAATAPLEKAWERLAADERSGADECMAEAASGRGGAEDDGADGDAGEGGDADDPLGSLAGPARRWSGPVPTPDDLAYLAHALVAVLDPDGAEPDDRDAQHRRGITLGRLRGGLRPIRGWLSPEVAAQLETVIDAMNNPAGEGAGSRVRFVPSGSDGSGSDGSGSDGSGSDPFNSDPRAVIDSRTALQKRHDALAAALGIAARHKDMPTLGGAAPTLVVTIDARDPRTADGAGDAARRAWRPARTGACPGRGAGGVLRHDPARHDARWPRDRHRQHRSGLHGAPASGDRRP